MKIELVKKTTAIYGKVFYWIRADDKMIEETWTDDLEKATASLQDVIERAKKFPKDTIETITEVEL
jgi:hypothetical protein